MKQQDFIEACYQQLLQVFQKAKAHQKDVALKHRTEGFIQAGKVLGLLSHQDAQDLMDKAHFDVFSESIAQRQQRKSALKQAIFEGDDGYIDIPTVLRNAK